jgi:hypothetical protein
VNNNELEFEVIGEMTEDCQWLWLPHFKSYQRTQIANLRDRKLEIVIRPYREIRSDAQRKYFYGVIIKWVQNWLFETQGEKHSKEDVYAWIRIKLLGHKITVKEVMGEEVIYMKDKRFSQMNTKEFADTVDEIRAKMLLRGLDIPEPNGNNDLHDFIK